MHDNVSFLFILYIFFFTSFVVCYNLAVIFATYIYPHSSCAIFYVIFVLQFDAISLQSNKSDSLYFSQHQNSLNAKSLQTSLNARSNQSTTIIILNTFLYKHILWETDHFLEN